jgi:pyruvate formate lyase activating enzyme
MRIALPLILIALILVGGFLLQKKESPPFRAGLYFQEKKEQRFLKEARYYQKLEGNLVQCNLCPRRCILREGQRGVCRVRENIGGKLYSLNYGKIVSANLDPIEKKPFFHFLPGTKTFSIAMAGCNLRCLYCQNWQISQVAPEQIPYFEMTPEEVVKKALESGAQSIAYTYSEPTVFFEFMLDTAKLAKEKGLKNVVVTSGFINPEPLRELCKYVDAIKVDLKGFNEEFYQKITKGSFQPILKAMKVIKEEGVWLEIVNLVIPGINDNEKDIRDLSLWIKENLGDEVPLHFSRFFPNYKMQNLPPTPLETIIRAREIALEVGLKYVYTGNVRYPEGESTFCPQSGQLAIERQGYFLIQNNLEEGICPSGEKIPGIW